MTYKEQANALAECSATRLKVILVTSLLTASPTHSHSSETMASISKRLHKLKNPKALCF